MASSPHWRTAPDLKGLYAETRKLRDIVLRRLAAVGCEIDEMLLPEAQAIVSANIGELVAAPEYEILLGYPSGERQILTLLVQSCAAEITAKIGRVAENRRKSTAGEAQRGTPLRLVAENGQLTRH